MLYMKINMTFRHVLLKIGLILIAIITFSIAEFPKYKTDYELEPLHYNVNLSFDFNKYVFLAENDITFYANDATTKLTMSSVIFGIVEIYVTDYYNQYVTNISKYSFIKNQLELDLNSPLVSKKYILKMRYVGSISDDENFHGSLYNELNATDVMTIKARQIFPCWNTSSHVTYVISISHNKQYTILSNMPIQKKVEDKKSMMWTHFDKTPPMLHEHFMILITNTLTNISSHANITFWCRQNITNHIRYAVNIAYRVVDFLKSKFQLTNILKIDYVVIWDSQHSSIETKGLVLIREEDIIYNKLLDSVARKMEVANLISRKVINFWYNDVFFSLKEGFVAFIGAYILHKIPLYLPSVIELFVVQQQHESLRFDTPSVIDPLALTCDRNFSTDHLIRSRAYYVKSPVIWLMLLYLLPHNIFWTSIQKYIDMQQINLMTTDQINKNQTNKNQRNKKGIIYLWNIMQDALDISNIPLKFNIEVMVNTMIMAKQYPVVYVTRDDLNDVIVFSYLSCNYTVNTNIKQHPILIKYTTKLLLEKKIDKYFWLCRRQKKYIFLEDKDDWIIANSAQSEYYRVSYDSSTWIKLTHYLNSENYTKIDLLRRAKIIDDAFHFLIYGQFNHTMFWNLLSFLSRETNYVVWYPMIKAFEYSTCVFPFYDAMEIKELMIKAKKILSDLLQNIGYSDKLVENDLIKYLREEAIRWACIFNVPGCRTTVTADLHLQLSVQNNSNAWKEWMYCTGLIQANATIFDDIWTKWNKTSNNRFLEYLTCCENPNIITSYLIKITNNNLAIQHIKRANIFFLIIAKHARNNIVLNFILENLFKFNLIEEETIVAIIVMITHVNDIFQLKKINAFVKNERKFHNSRHSIVKAVDQKIKKRKMEYEKQVTKYRSLVLAKIVF